MSCSPSLADGKVKADMKLTIRYMNFEIHHGSIAVQDIVKAYMTIPRI